MQFTNPIPNRANSIRTHESSPQRSLRDSDSVLKSWGKTGDLGWRMEQMARAIHLLQSNLARMRRRINGGTGRDTRWQEPKELDPNFYVAKGTWVYISPHNSLVDTGLTDIVAGVNKQAYPGIWEAAQDVPAESGGSYNVPQIDYPGATGTPSGSPLNGDLDGENVFWILICPTCEL